MKCVFKNRPLWYSPIDEGMTSADSTPSQEHCSGYRSALMRQRAVSKGKQVYGRMNEKPRLFAVGESGSYLVVRVSGKELIISLAVSKGHQWKDNRFVAHCDTRTSVQTLQKFTHKPAITSIIPSSTCTLTSRHHILRGTSTSWSVSKARTPSPWCRPAK